MKRIGLTGGMGTGKSTVSQYLKSRKIDIIDADAIARQIVAPGSSLLARLAETFGTVILMPDGSLNRRKLGAIAFADERQKRKLDQIMHGAIMEQIQADLVGLEQQGMAVVFIDAPLLLETSLKDLVEEVWLVDAEVSVQIERVRQRDGLSEKEITDRIQNQMPREEKRRLADFILDNSKDLPYLYRQIDALLYAVGDGGKA